ncbi:hypothetical protein [uncultured Acetobacteroides sp.]|uniref:hypothetical protein n=1 Tax=uncultured Acetobacteroides sp. TaxID=1760811 RepID=UPI0029F58CD1|nr:hypothetical protein [uncultured Acetobacteroides sp.]
MENNSKIKLSTNVPDLLTNLQTLITKHKSEGESSPLHALPSVNIPQMEAILPKALALQKEAEELKAKTDAKYRERDNCIEPIAETLRLSKNLLKVINEKNPKVLAEWGFNVSYTTNKKTTKKVTKNKKNPEE